MAEVQAFENPFNSHIRSNNRAVPVMQLLLVTAPDSGHHDHGFNHVEGGDPMSSEIRAGGSDFGYEVILTGQPSAR